MGKPSWKWSGCQAFWWPISCWRPDCNAWEILNHEHQLRCSQISDSPLQTYLWDNKYVICCFMLLTFQVTYYTASNELGGTWQDFVVIVVSQGKKSISRREEWWVISNAAHLSNMMSFEDWPLELVTGDWGKMFQGVVQTKAWLEWVQKTTKRKILGAEKNSFYGFCHKGQ